MAGLFAFLDLRLRRIKAQRLGRTTQGDNMSMDNIPASSQSDGRWKIAATAVGTGTAPNPLSVAVLKGANSTNVTYSFLPDGFNYTETQAEVMDPRLTLLQVLSRPGKVTPAFTTRYVDSDDPASAAVLFEPGKEFFFTVRKKVDNSVDWTTGQKASLVIRAVAGVQVQDAPTENGLDTITQGWYLTAVTRKNEALVA